MATASSPPTIEVGFTQLDQGSPAFPPAGTRPEAIAPAIAPMQYGTSTDDEREQGPEGAPLGQPDEGLAEGEARAAQDDPEGDERTAARTA